MINVKIRLTYLILIISNLIISNPNQSNLGCECEDGWLDSRENKLGCLLFESSVRSYSEASQYCEDRNAHLVEVLTQEQLDFLRNHLRNTYGAGIGSCTNAATCWCWWGGATKGQNPRQKRACGGIESCGRAYWYWPNSGQQVGNFIWADSDPDSSGGGQQGLCFYGSKDPKSDYMAIDWPASYTNPLICQQCQKL